MNWEQLFSGKRTGVVSVNQDSRTAYQRDFDRLIFSSGFRRLQNKTQVFPLPGSTFVHNRLTHSLEVASVGRSLGAIVGKDLVKQENFSDDANWFYENELRNVISAACLAHDIGNPAFGHSGEKAISNYFEENYAENIGSAQLKTYYSANEWEDLINFEGNANAIRVLANKFKGKSNGGYRLTHSTLAAIMKYPCESTAVDKKNIHTKKYGFFQSEKVLALAIFNEMGMIQEKSSPIVFKRHPFVYLTEAADDICYRIVDLEDASRLGIIPFQTVKELLMELITQLDPKTQLKESNTLKQITDKNEAIAYLRAISINNLTQNAASIFLGNTKEIISGNFNTGLVEEIEKSCNALHQIKKISQDLIYGHHSVLEIEISGYNLMSSLLSIFIPACLKPSSGQKEGQILKLLPHQFSFNESDSPYEKTMCILDYISGMTDDYASDLYKKLHGINIPKHN